MTLLTSTWLGFAASCFVVSVLLDSSAGGSSTNGFAKMLSSFELLEGNI